MFDPNDEVDQEIEHDQEKPGKNTTDSVAPIEDIEQGSEVGLSIVFLQSNSIPMTKWAFWSVAS